MSAPVDAARAPRTVPTEPVLAVVGLAATLVGQLLVRAGGLWVVLDAVGLVVSAGALRALLRRRFGGRGTGVLLLLDAVGLAAVTGAIALLAFRGPEPRIASVALMVLTGAGTGLTLLVAGTGLVTAYRSRPGAEDGAPVEAAPDGDRAAVLVAAAAAAVTALVVLKDALLR